ncbi:hypothetical protein K439DRAFT_1620696 [Ramaria rubella]|nr:hypothetical protein K439DRAFT_1620696 [Ramaria rubella]
MSSTDSERCTYCKTKGALFKLFRMVSSYTTVVLACQSPALSSISTSAAYTCAAGLGPTQGCSSRGRVKSTPTVARPNASVRAMLLWISPCQDTAVCFIKCMGRMTMYGMGNGWMRDEADLVCTLGTSGLQGWGGQGGLETLALWEELLHRSHVADGRPT